METWKPIPDAPGYEVSDQGRVRSLPRERVIVRMGIEHVRQINGQLLTPTMHFGVARVKLYLADGERNVAVAELVKTVFA